MKIKILALIFVFVCGVSPVFALTHSERKIAQRALSELTEAKAQFKSANDKLVEADARAATAEQHAAEADAHAAQTDAAASKVSKDIDIAHANEQRMANEVKVYKPFYDQGHKYWGIGAIILGLGLLFKHLLIALLVLIGLAIVVFIASFFFPEIGVGLQAARKIIAVALARIALLVHSHPFQPKNPAAPQP